MDHVQGQRRQGLPDRALPNEAQDVLVALCHMVRDHSDWPRLVQGRRPPLNEGTLLDCCGQFSVGPFKLVRECLCAVTHASLAVFVSDAGPWLGTGCGGLAPESHRSPPSRRRITDTVVM